MRHGEYVRWPGLCRLCLQPIQLNLTPGAICYVDAHSWCLEAEKAAKRHLCERPYKLPRPRWSYATR